MRGYPRSKRLVFALVLTASVIGVRIGYADPIPVLSHRAKEFAARGSATSVEGNSNLSLALSGEYYLVLGGVTTSLGSAVAYRKVSSLDVFDLEGYARAYFRLGNSANYLFAGAAGGPRQEWLGSFSQVRYPLGADLGVKVLLTPRVAWSVVYMYRRILNDPVANFSEKRIEFGFSVLFDN